MGAPPAHRHARAAAVLSVALGLALTASLPLDAQSLRGSRGTVDRQNIQARAHDFTFLDNTADVRRFVKAGYLVPVRGNADYRVKRISFPYARPAVELFLRRLGQQYREACGEQLVVTSLTRPRNRQPRNASPRSVHPTGMAMDLRRSQRPACRNWLERVLLDLEGRGVLEAVREMRPPHYHVALFPEPYVNYVAALGGSTRLASATRRYRVRAGDSLWEIAQRHGTSVAALREANNLRGSRIIAGRELTIP